MKLHAIYISIISLALSLVSCGHKDEPDDKTTHRTVLAYVAAANSLGSYGEDMDDIAQMIEAVQKGELHGGRLLVYHAPKNGTDTLKEITPEGVKVLEIYKRQSAVSVSRMTTVFSDMKRHAPAKDYGLILWSHATGWLSPLGKSVSARSWGEHNGAKMSIPDLATALSGVGFSFIYFDCCFMGNVESLYELRGTTRYIVASPAEVVADGMPYVSTINHFFTPEADMVGAAKTTFKYYDNLSGARRTCTIAVYDMSKIDALAAATRDVLMSNTVLPDGYVPQTYGRHGMYETEFFDLGYYITSLTDNDRLLDNFNRAMDDFVIYSANTPYIFNQTKLEHCSGLSSYIVDDVKGPGYYQYDSLQWWYDVVAPAFGQ